VKTTRKGKGKKTPQRGTSEEGQSQYMGLGNGRGGERELSYTQVIRQHGGQRLRSLQKHNDELVRVSQAMATLGINVALRGLTLEFILDELQKRLLACSATGDVNGRATGLAAAGSASEDGPGRLGSEQDADSDAEAKAAADGMVTVRQLRH